MVVVDWKSTTTAREGGSGHSWLSWRMHDGAALSLAGATPVSKVDLLRIWLEQSTAVDLGFNDIGKEEKAELDKEEIRSSQRVARCSRTAQHPRMVCRSRTVQLLWSRWWS